MALPRISRIDFYPNIPKNRKLQLFQISDVHLGAKTHLKKAFTDTIEKIRKTRFTKVILFGDLIENNTKTSVGEGWVEQVLTPTDQLELINEMLHPIKHKIIGISRGNHEARTTKESGVDIVDGLADKLGIERLLSHAQIRVNIDDSQHTVLVTHGSSGAGTVGGKINACEKMVHIYRDADLYMYGHVHDLVSWKRITYGMDGIKLRHFALNGSFMDYLDSYAQEKNYPPGMPGYITAMVGRDGINLNKTELWEYMDPGIYKVIDERPVKQKV